MAGDDVTDVGDAGAPAGCLGVHEHRGDGMRRRAFLAMLPLSYIAINVAPALARASTGNVLNIVAHQDDDLLFMSPSMESSVLAGATVRTVYLTAGDAGQAASYWQGRENGVKAAYANIAGVANNWTQADAGVTGHPIPVYTLAGSPNVSLAFLRLPDGNTTGDGFPSTGNQSLARLWNGSIATMTTVDGTSSYSLSDLSATLLALLAAFQPAQVNTLDFLGSYSDGDHPDHHTAAYLAKAAVVGYNTSVGLTGYQGYPVSSLPANVSGSSLTTKQNAFFAYAPYDSLVCHSIAACAATPYDGWLARQYTVWQARGPQANSGPVSAVLPGGAVQLDGSGSTDPSGNTLSYAWTQTAGAAVALSDPTAVRPTFTAPQSTGILTFQLVVTNAVTSVTSEPSTVAVFVTNTPANLAQSATASASSQAPGQPASASIDGVVGGYPAKPGAEWATNGGGAGSWLRLTWSTARSVDTVVLYDRPNLNDQITGGNLTFSDGSVLPVESLPDNGASYVLSFAPRSVTSLQLNITAVSSTTSSVGLAEIQVFDTGFGSSGLPVADPGSDQIAVFGQTVALDGSGSSDPAGYGLSYQWSQTTGAAVALSSPADVRPTFTAPSSLGVLTFQLIVSDKQGQASAPVTVKVTMAAKNLALSATATASSAAPGQPASAAIDGVISGYPANSAAEWSTYYGGVGSWLLLTWASPTPLDTVVLYDRPNLDDQIVGGTITFSDGTSLPVGTLPNDGSACTLTFPGKTVTTLKLNVTSVSDSTQSVGLAEIQAFRTGTSVGGTPVAVAGAAQTVTVGTTVTLDGSESSDPTGEGLSFEWSQTSGPAVGLSTVTAMQPTFIAPSQPASLTFALVVTDSAGAVSPAAAVTVTVVAENLALSATATASSQSTSTGQTASKAIDGVIGGYPGNSSAEWATVYGGQGSWLLLTWPSAQTFDTVVLYDRPNSNDQVTAGNLSFADGSSVSIGTLPNDGSPYTVSFAAKTSNTLKLAITAVSSTTQSVGLAEIQVYNNGNGTGGTPVANAGSAQTVPAGANVSLDGTGSTDPSGYTLSYQWTQTGGTAVTLSDATIARPAFTAPSVGGTLTFQLVVTDSHGYVSAPGTVPITVTAPVNLALSATATASSENTSTSQTAAKAIDGIVSGYPANYSAEWATVNGGAGSWLQLTWTSAQTFNTITLYDRPNGNDQVTAGIVTFSDGSSVSVGTLPNDGSAYTLSFAEKTVTTLTLTITGVSASTQNVGLSEIEIYNL